MLTKTTVLLLAAGAISVTLAQLSAWDQSARNHVLHIHNYFRRIQGGCQINKLEYDIDLETQARTWAQGCVYKHEVIKGRGENIHYTTIHKKETCLITRAVKKWMHEKSNYSRGQDGCGKSCQYTQMVWHDTQKVGCYSNRCPVLCGAQRRDAWYLVCLYHPKGNWASRTPFKTSCDTPCHTGQHEERGLCIGDVILPCVNDNELCESWASNGGCTGKNTDYMNRFCRKACKKCS